MISERAGVFLCTFPVILRSLQTFPSLEVSKGVFDKLEGDMLFIFDRLLKEIRPNSYNTNDHPGIVKYYELYQPFISSHLFCKAMSNLCILNV